MNDVFFKSICDGRVVGSPLFTSENFEARCVAFKEQGIKLKTAVGVCVNNTPAALLDMLVLLHLKAVLVPLPPQNPREQTLALWQRLHCEYALEDSGLRKLSDAKNLYWPDDVALIMHSSGSTGIPKSIPYGYKRLQKNAQLMMDFLCDDPKTARHIGAMSYCTSGGFYNAVLTPLFTGGTVIAAPAASAFGVRRFVEISVNEKADHLWVSPTVLKMLAGPVLAESLPQDARFISCTAPLTHADAIEFENQFKRPVLQSYGLTETLFVTVEKRGRDVVREFSSGLVLGGSEGLSFDKASGVICIHNGCVMPGYAVVTDGNLNFEMPDGGVAEKIFKTSDLGELDGAGRLTLTGRVSNVINVEGFKIGMEILEEALLKLDFVNDVAVTRSVDESGSEKPVVLIVSKNKVSEEILVSACVEAGGPKARPGRVVVVDKIPKTANGKIDRVALERQYGKKS